MKQGLKGLRRDEEGDSGCRKEWGKSMTKQKEEDERERERERERKRESMAEPSRHSVK